MRDVSQALANAQSAAVRRPYIYLYFTSQDGSQHCDYSTRVLSITHDEQAYQGTATVVLQNNDRQVQDVRGYWAEIGYGDELEGGPDYRPTPRLWVKRQSWTSAPGNVTSTLYLEDGMLLLAERKVTLGTEGESNADGTPRGLPNYRYIYNESHTVREIVAGLLNGFDGLEFFLTGTADDGIINTLKPYLTINSQPHEDYWELISRLMAMTKCFLCPQTARTFALVYPQAGDAVNAVYYSWQAPFFYQYTESRALCIPDLIKTFANQSSDGTWGDYKLGVATDIESGSRYPQMVQIDQAASLRTPEAALARAEAILTSLKRDTAGAAFLIQHDCRLELYDRVQVQDKRGLAEAITYPTDPIIRVTGLSHRYDRAQGLYQLGVYLGGLVNYPLPYVEPPLFPYYRGKTGGYEVERYNGGKLGGHLEEE